MIRFFFAQTQYRSPPDFSNKALENAEKGLTRIHRLKEKLESLSGNKIVDKLDKKSLKEDEKKYFDIVSNFVSDFENAMDDDFNTPEAISAIFEFVNKTNYYLEKNPTSDKKLCGYALGMLIKLSNVLTLFQPSLVESKISVDKDLLQKLQRTVSKYKKDVKEEDIEKLIGLLLKIREEARKKKDWKTADNIRKDLDDIGFEIQDTSEGPVWRKNEEDFGWF